MYDLILVGGTGQRFGMVLGWLCLLGLAKPPRQILIIDAEDEEKSITAKNLKLVFSWFVEDENFQRYTPYLLSAGNKVGDQLDLAQNQQSKKIWDLCFTQQETDEVIEQGFMANPKLGATVFTHLMCKNLTRPLDRFLDQKSGQRVPVMIAGSVAGGTGAGLIYTIAQQCRSTLPAEVSIFGMIYTNYLSLPADKLELERKLDQNSRCGTDFLWRMYASTDTGEYPFNVLTFIGPPEFYKATQASEEMHPYPGFLLGVSQMADGCLRMQNEVDESRKRQNNSSPGIQLLAVRQSRENYLFGSDLIFDSSNNKSKITVDDFESYLVTTNKQLMDMKNHPWHLATNGLFPKRKITTPVWKTILQDGKFSKTKYNESMNHVKNKIQQIQNFIYGQNQHSFRDWMHQLSHHGLKRDNTSEVSPRISSKNWVDCLGVHDGNANRLAISWINDVMQQQIKNQTLEKKSDANLCWAFPYPCMQKATSFGRHQQIITSRKELPDIIFSRRSTQEPSDNSILLEETGSNFPTPLGRVEFVRRILRNDIQANNNKKSHIWEKTRALWSAVVLGWVDIIIHDLEINIGDSISHVIHKITNQKYMQTVKISKSFNTPVRLKNISSDAYIGAWDRECGFWIGVDDIQNNFTSQTIDVILDCLKNNPRDEIKAILTLQLWQEDLSQKIFNNDNLILSIIKSIVLHRSSHLQQSYTTLWEELKNSFNRDHIATCGPVFIQSENSEPDSDILYLYRYEYMRSIRRLIFAGVVAGSDNMTSFRVERNIASSDYIYYDLHSLQEVARLRFDSRQQDKLTSQISHKVRFGCLDLKISDSLTIGRKPDISNDKFNSSLPDGLAVVASHLSQQPHHIDKPDLLW